MSKSYTSINEHTNARMVTKPSSKAYDDNFDRIFRKKVCEYCEKPIDDSVKVEYDGMLFHEWCVGFANPDEWKESEEG